MRMITKAIAKAFQGGESKSVDNTRTDGKAIYLFGNKIVERRGDEVWVSLGGHSFSKTTQERLSPFCRVSRRGGNLTLNGEPWDGEWVKINKK